MFQKYKKKVYSLGFSVQNSISDIEAVILLMDGLTGSRKDRPSGS